MAYRIRRHPISGLARVDALSIRSQDHCPRFARGSRACIKKSPKSCDARSPTYGSAYVVPCDREERSGEVCDNIARHLRGALPADGAASAAPGLPAGSGPCASR